MVTDDEKIAMAIIVATCALACWVLFPPPWNDGPRLSERADTHELRVAAAVVSAVAAAMACAYGTGLLHWMLGHI